MPTIVSYGLCFLYYTLLKSTYLCYYVFMSLAIGIVGLPNVGKSTLFNALTDAGALAANYPFATIEPNTGIVPVPDERLSVLQKMYNAEKVIPATVTFVDIAGLVAGASKGEGLGNQFLANIRECDAIVHVVRAFHDDDILRHDSAPIDPAKDIDIITTELCLADIQTLDNRRSTLEKQAKSSPKLREDIELLDNARQLLLSGVPIGTKPDIALRLTSIVHCLTSKPTIYVFNVDEAGLTDEKLQSEMKSLVAPADMPATPDNVVFVCAKLEEELRDLDETDAAELLESYGVHESGLAQLARAAYHTLGLQSYLTAGPKEVRAWTIKKGATAPEAAGVIHTDFEKGFIAAQIVDYSDLIELGSELAAKNAGKIHTVGRDYRMQPGDVVEFKFNVSKH